MSSKIYRARHFHSNTKSSSSRVLFGTETKLSLSSKNTIPFSCCFLPNFCVNILTIPPLITALLKYPPALFGLPLNLWRKSFGLGGIDSLARRLSKALLKNFNKVYEHFLVFIPDTRICTKKCITRQHHKKKSNQPNNRFWILSEK